MSIERFVTRLSRFSPPPNCINPWRGRSAAAKLRKSNLTAYFNQMAAFSPTMLLVGEAPGYRGCGLTGIPFTSERILVEGAAGLFGDDSNFHIVGQESKPISEASATMVWDALEQTTGRLPLIWNAFPFHPHHAGDKNSNRAPNRAELEIGHMFLQNLLKSFPEINFIVAVGNRADQMLTRFGLVHHKVRHPSHGGKRDFVAGLSNIFIESQHLLKEKDGEKH